MGLVAESLFDSGESYRALKLDHQLPVEVTGMFSSFELSSDKSNVRMLEWCEMGMGDS